MSRTILCADKQEFVIDSKYLHAFSVIETVIRETTGDAPIPVPCDSGSFLGCVAFVNVLLPVLKAHNYDITTHEDKNLPPPMVSQIMFYVQTILQSIGFPVLPHNIDIPMPVLPTTSDTTSSTTSINNERLEIVQKHVDLLNSNDKEYLATLSSEHRKIIDLRRRYHALLRGFDGLGCDIGYYVLYEYIHIALMTTQHVTKKPIYEHVDMERTWMGILPQTVEEQQSFKKDSEYIIEEPNPYILMTNPYYTGIIEAEKDEAVIQELKDRAEAFKSAIRKHLLGDDRELKIDSKDILTTEEFATLSEYTTTFVQAPVETLPCVSCEGPLQVDFWMKEQKDGEENETNTNQ